MVGVSVVTAEQMCGVETHTFWFGLWHFQKRIYFIEFKFNSEDSEETRREKNMYIQIAIAEINKVDIYLIDFWLQLLFKNKHFEPVLVCCGFFFKTQKHVSW